MKRVFFTNKSEEEFDEELSESLENKVTVKYLDYDWGLNEQKQ